MRGCSPGDWVAETHVYRAAQRRSVWLERRASQCAPRESNAAPRSCVAPTSEQLVDARLRRVQRRPRRTHALGRTILIGQAALHPLVRAESTSEGMTETRGCLCVRESTRRSSAARVLSPKSAVEACRPKPDCRRRILQQDPSTARERSGEQPLSRATGQLARGDLTARMSTVGQFTPRQKRRKRWLCREWSRTRVPCDGRLKT